MKIKANCGTLFYVMDNHPFLSEGVFKILDFQENSELDLPFLNFVFHGITNEPLVHAKMAQIYGLRNLAKETYLANIGEKIQIGELVGLFSWNELPDFLAVQLLTDPSSKDLTEIIKLEYVLCYTKFANRTTYVNYVYLGPNFLRNVISELGIDESFVICCANNHLEMTKTLLSLGANIFEPRALKLAVKNGNLEIVKYLGSIGVDYKLEMWSAIQSAAINGHLEMMKYFISCGHRSYVVDEYLLGLVAAQGHFEVMVFLISTGMNIRASRDYAIRMAAENGQLEIVKYLVSLGANPNAEDDYAVKSAVARGETEMVRYLVELGADVISSGKYILKSAVCTGKIELVEYLVSCGINSDADIHLSRRKAAKLGFRDLVEYLESIVAHKN